MAILLQHVAAIRLRRRGAGVGALLLPLLLVALALVALGYVAYVLWPRWPEVAAAPDAPALPIVVGGVTFNVPPKAVRIKVQHHPGPHERVDLAFLWPSLAPPERTGTREASAAVTADRIFVTIAETAGALPPTERLTVIYPRYAIGKPSTTTEGLAELNFRDGSPYQGEDLFYDPIGPDRFLARCNRSRNPLTPASCLLEKFVGGASVTVRFPRDWLTDWRLVASGIERLIDQLRARTG
jgi:hypothetical protein